MSHEAVENGGAPAWLFSFLDLAFLMLIAMTMVPTAEESRPDLGEMTVPRIGEEASEELAGSAAKAWQVRVHPPVQSPDGSLEPPFEVLLAGAGALGDGGDLLDKARLDARLDALLADGVARPLLAPHEDSRSQDLLDAVALIEARWPSPRRALVARLMEGG
jgi:hypothetical protein